MRKFTLLFILLFVGAIKLYAQREIGIATGNWSGTNSMYLNPAYLADNRDKFTIDLVSLNFGVDNTLGTLNLSNTTKRFFNGDSVGSSDIFKYSNKNPFNLLAPYGEVRGPGALISIDRKNSIAITTRIRAFNQFTNFDQSLYRVITDPNDYGKNGNYNISARNFNMTENLWSEIGLSYARVLLEKGKSQLKAGITVRYLGGIAYLSIKGNSIDGTYDSTNNTVAVSNTNIDYSSNIASTSNTLTNGVSNADLLSKFFGGKGGSGIGGDIGVSYEYCPDLTPYRYDMDGQTGLLDPGANKYLFRISASVTDIGFINYSNTNNYSLNVQGTGTISGNDFAKNVTNYQDFKNYAINHGFIVDSTEKKSGRVYLPTALVVSADYHIWKGFYANATFIGNLANRSNYGNSYYSQVTVTPRYDSRLFSVGVPLTYSALTSGFKAGLGVRVAGFFFGSDDALAFFSNNQYGVNFYVGGFVPISRHKPKDSDHDHVSNKKDQCPNIAGVWEYHGCPDPDTDHDGVPDSVDKCPTIPGSPTAMGCPDRDLDSVADAQDRCPDEAGPVALQGCPDRDHDGIPDIDDKCPDQAGPAKYSGCPDTDGDGIPDNEDQCPDKPGPAALHGCPDTDGDGVPDNLDKCPTQAGPASNNGCPVVKVEVKEEVKKRLAFAATAIQFQTGKAIIKKQSYPLLDEIVGILNEYPDYYMTIDGHTDNVGKPAINMKLSKDRADAVRNYFISKGIVPSRLETHGYGDTQPVASNKTAAGRAKNRRVAMDLKLMDGK